MFNEVVGLASISMQYAYINIGTSYICFPDFVLLKRSCHVHSLQKEPYIKFGRSIFLHVSKL